MKWRIGLAEGEGWASRACGSAIMARMAQRGLAEKGAMVL